MTRESFYPARRGCLRGRDVLTELPIPVATHSDGHCRNLCRPDGRRVGRYCLNSDRLAVVVASSGQSDLVNLIWSTSVTTFVFNANPLMKFDGYYILSDLLDRPNLYTNSSLHLQRIANRVFFGSKTDSVRSSRQDALLPASYGAAAFVWRMLICVGLLISASMMFHGAGMVAAAAGVLLWFGQPILQLTRKIWHRARLDPQESLQAIVLSSAVTAVLGAFLFLVPWPAGATAPGIIDHWDLAVVRAETPCFVRNIQVADGEKVSQGQLLIELENEELANEVADIRVAIQQSDIRRSQFIR